MGGPTSLQTGRTKESGGGQRVWIFRISSLGAGVRVHGLNRPATSTTAAPRPSRDLSRLAGTLASDPLRCMPNRARENPLRATAHLNRTRPTSSNSRSSGRQKKTNVKLT